MVQSLVLGIRKISFCYYFYVIPARIRIINIDYRWVAGRRKCRVLAVSLHCMAMPVGIIEQ